MLAAQEPDSPITNYSQQTAEGELAYEIQEIPLELKISSSRTIRSNKTAANNFREYLREKGIDEQFEKFDKETLNKTLGQFYIDARQADGTHYKVNSLENFRYGINRYLKSPPYFRKIDIIKDHEFFDANHLFKVAISELRRLGKGDVDHHPVITDVDLKTLYASAHLDPNTPAGLLNKVQFDIRMYFFRRGMENMSKMTKSTFKVMKDPETGMKIVVKVDETGNQKENDHENSTGIMPEYSGSHMCPVKSFELYLSKVHPDCDRLWQRPREHFYQNDEIWFCRSAVGEKNLAKFMSNLSKICSLSQTYTNHSIRATGASILRNYFEPAQIMAVMGQKSALYLSGYQRISNKEKISMGQAITASLSNGASLAFPSSIKSVCNPVEMDTGTILLENQERGSNMVADVKTSSHSQSLRNVSHHKAKMEFVLSRRGKRKLILNGFLYVNHKSVNDVIYWRCDKYAACKSRMSTKGNKIQNPPTDHDHGPVSARIEVEKAMSGMRERATNSDENPSAIIQNMTQIFSQVAAGKLPKKSSLIRMIRRKRKGPEGDARKKFLFF